MSGNVDMLVRYQQLLKMSQSMLTLATAGRWDDLVDCEKNYLQTVEQVTLTSLPAALSPGLHDQIRRAVAQIQANDKQLKALLNGRLTELQGLVDSTTHQRNISSTYGKISGNVLYPGKI